MKGILILLSQLKKKKAVSANGYKNLKKKCENNTVSSIIYGEMDKSISCSLTSFATK